MKILSDEEYSLLIDNNIKNKARADFFEKQSLNHYECYRESERKLNTMADNSRFVKGLEEQIKRLEEANQQISDRLVAEIKHTQNAGFLHDQLITTNDCLSKAITALKLKKG